MLQQLFCEFQETSPKQNKNKTKQNKQTNPATKPKNKKTEEKSCNSYRSEQQEQTLQQYIALRPLSCLL
jgi:hypothetical protein